MQYIYDNLLVKSEYDEGNSMPDNVLARKQKNKDNMQHPTIY